MSRRYAENWTQFRSILPSKKGRIAPGKVVAIRDEHYYRQDGVHPALVEVRKLGKDYLLAVILGM